MTIGRIEIVETRNAAGCLLWAVLINGRPYEVFGDRPAAVRTAKALERRYERAVFVEDAPRPGQ